VTEAEQAIDEAATDAVHGRVDRRGCRQVTGAVVGAEVLSTDVRGLSN
jgi:hypothetical protein